MGIYPKMVYVHAGTRAGAKAMGLDIRRPYLKLDELPTPLRTLPAHEIEDLLCIFKDRLKNHVSV